MRRTNRRNHRNNNRGDSFGTKSELLGNWFIKYAKIIMPVILIVCVAVTIVIAVNANKKDAEQQEGVEANSTLDGAEGGTRVIPQVPLLENTDPKIEELVKTYYMAMVEGDTDTIRTLVNNLDDTEVLRIQESSKYIEDYPIIDIYTKPGLKENTVLVYVCSEVKFIGVEQSVPGMKGLFVRIDEDGQYRIIEDGMLDKDEGDYAKALNLQNDVVDMNNRVAAKFNDMMATNLKLAEFIVDMQEEIEKNVGKVFAEAEENNASEEGTDVSPADAESEGEGQEGPVTVVTRVRATDVVNIRSSDSETADKLGKAAIGDEFKLLEKIGNGWSRIEYEGSEAYIKSEFLEDIETETQEAQAPTENNQEPAVSGTVTAKENVRIRSGASETSEKVGVAYAGDKLELVMKRADGWTEIKYNGKTAYVKSDYVE